MGSVAAERTFITGGLAHESTCRITRLHSLLPQTHPAFERGVKGERATRDATHALPAHETGSRIGLVHVPEPSG